MDCKPKLRFPEFSGEWEEIIGKEIFNVLGGGAFSSKDSQENGVKWLKIANVGINKIKTNDVSYLPIEFQKEYGKYILKKEDIVIALTRPTLGSKLKIALIDDYFDNSLLNQRVGKLIPNEGGIKDFIYYLLQLKKNIAYIENQISGTDPPNLSIKDLINAPLSVPTLIEQEKIASFLSKVDSKIDLLEKKQELWETYKKGIMQQIFSQKLRFKDENGEDYPDWEEKKLVNILDLIRNGFSGPQVSYETDYPVTRIETISSGEINYDKVGFVNEIDESYKLVDGDILISNINSVQHIGKLAYYDDNITLYHGMNLLLLRFKDNYNKKFLYYYLSFNKRWFERMSCQAVNQASINQETVKKFKDIMPTDLQEQTKIANMISLIDIRINKIIKEAKINREFKRGLLQQMFC
jgi:type I restriction enzyme S subunit